MRSLTQLDPEEVARLKDQGEFFWLDLQDADDALVDRLGEVFGFHRLALEDSREFGQRPKLDDYEDHVLIVWFGVHGGEPVEIHVYVSGDAVVTLHRGHCDVLAEAHRRLEERPVHLEGAVVYRVLDALTDSFYPLLEGMDDRIESLEEELFGPQAGAESQRQEIFTMRRELVGLRRIVGPQRDVFASGGGVLQRVPGLDVDRAHDAFRDVYDHMLSIADQVDGQRELLSEALDLHSAAVSNRVNESSKQLAVISTIFLPLTFVTGFFGQNFGWLTDHVDPLWAFLLYGVGGLVLSTALIFLALKRSGALDD